ncbi:hypothetical protein MALG_00978 [Marinovum algicola DG 898]|nr:hypothetical protein MALG_00978 [Marinovum algicola DG 898]
MQPIDNPLYSRPLDVHRWSDHPEAKGLVEQVWERGLRVRFETKRDGKAKPGPKPKADHKVMLRVLILDLYVAWKEDPELSIGVSKNVNSWKAGSRYNALHLSKNIIKVVDALGAEGFIDVAPGSYAEPGAPTNRTTRIRASEKLCQLFEATALPEEQIGHAGGAEIIVLKRGEDADGNAERGGKPVEYEDTKQTIRMREQLQAYIDLINSSFIDIACLEEPVIVRGKSPERKVVRISPAHSHIRRIFNRNSWKMNGRFYGPWWQSVNALWRSRCQSASNCDPLSASKFDRLGAELARRCVVSM